MGQAQSVANSFQVGKNTNKTATFKSRVFKRGVAVTTPAYFQSQ
jgi:hypothetical protein